MKRLMLRSSAAVRSRAAHLRTELAERGEGVISAAIAVLIMAFLGAGMWLAFNNIFQSSARNTCEQVNAIGNPASPADCSAQ